MYFLAILFTFVTLFLIAATALLVVRTGFARLDSTIGIMGDGLAQGKTAPPWSLPDTAGKNHTLPSGNVWQFLVFADHSLGAFLSVVNGMHALAAQPDLEVLLLSRGSSEECLATSRGLGLQIDVVPSSDALYNQYRVRVMPFGFLIKPDGTVAWSGLINTDAQMQHVWQLSRVLKQEAA